MLGQPVAPRSVAWARLSEASSCFGAAVGVWALAWPTLDVPIRGSVTPGADETTPAAAALLIASSAAVLLLTGWREGARWERVARGVGRAIAALVALLGLAGLTGFALPGHGVSFGFLPPGLEDRLASVHLTFPAALSFALLGTALVWHRPAEAAGHSGLGRGLTTALAAVAFLVAFLALVGSIVGLTGTFAIARGGAVAVAFATACLLLAASVVLAVPGSSLAAVVRGEDAGGVMIRRLLPVALLLPVMINTLGPTFARQNHLGSGLERIGRTTAVSGLLLAMVLWTARRLRSLDAKRLRSIDAERRARAETETLAQELQRRTTLLEQTTDAVFAWTLEEANACRITYWNRGSEVLYGYSREEAIGRVSHELMKTDGPARLQEFEATLRKKRGWAGQLRHVTKDGRRLVVESRQVLVREPDGRTLVLESNRDVTEQVRRTTFARLLGDAANAANAAVRIEDALQVIVGEICGMLSWPVGHAYLASRDYWGEFAATSVWHLDSPARHGVFRDATGLAERAGSDRMLGRAVTSGVAIWVEDVTADLTYPRREAARQAGLAAGITALVMVGDEVVGFLEFFSADREPVDEEVLAVFAQVGVQVGRVVERQWLQEVRQLNLDRVITAQEDERRRIARELHDSLGQHLTALLLGLGSLRDACARDPVAAARLSGLESLAQTMGGETRDLALNLRPVVLDDLGLASALTEYAGRWASQSGIPADVHVGGLGPERLPAPSETALYRIVQEALTNVARHAGATRVSIILQTTDSGVRAIVEDDGQGFDPDQLLRLPAFGRRLGLLGMQERIALVGGTLTVESSPGYGTTVYARVPMAAHNGASEVPALREVGHG